MSLTFLGIAGVIISYLLNHLISTVNPFLLQFFNLYSILIVYIALRKFNPSSILISAFAGILEDINTFLPVGVNALKKLILLYLVNRISKFISISSLLGYFILIFFSVLFELLLLLLITAFFGLKNPLRGFREILLFQPLITSLFGVPLFVFFSKITYKD